MGSVLEFFLDFIGFTGQSSQNFPWALAEQMHLPQLQTPLFEQISPPPSCVDMSSYDAIETDFLITNR